MHAIVTLSPRWSPGSWGSSGNGADANGEMMITVVPDVFEMPLPISTVRFHLDCNGCRAMALRCNSGHTFVLLPNIQI